MVKKQASKLDALVQLLIPPSLVLLLVVTLAELFWGAGKLALFIDIFDIYVITIFAIDLYYRYHESKHWPTFLKTYWLDIIATIPFNIIFHATQALALTQGLRGVRIIGRAARLTREARLIRLLRLTRFGARAPRFLRLRHKVKKAKIRKVQPHEKELKGVLSFRTILLITINSIMGTGIFFLTAAGAKHAGPASLISWGVLSLISIYIAMCFAELTSMFPKAGGVYEFAKQTYGRFASFVIGWTTAIAGSVTIAMLLLGALQYAIPLEYSQWYIPIAILLILLFNYVAYRGMQTSTYVLITFALVTLGTVLALIVPGFFELDLANYQPFLVFPSFTILLTIFFIAETFFGWESAIFLSAETKNPAKVMPKALIYGTIVIALLSFLLAFIGMGVIPWEQYGSSAAPLRDIGSALFGQTGSIIFTVMVFISIIGAVACWVVTAPRLLMSIAEDKLFFVQFAKIHPKHKSPYVAILFQVLLITSLVIVGAGSYETLLHMLIPLILAIYSAVLLGVVILRFKRPHQRRPYKVIWGKVGPIITVAFMAFLLAMFVFETHDALQVLKISGFLILLGVPAYFAIELFYEPKYVVMRASINAFLMHYFGKLPLPRRTFNKIMRYVGPFNKRTTLLISHAPLSGFASHVLKKGHEHKQLTVLSTVKEDLKYFQRELTKDQEKKINLKLLRTRRIHAAAKDYSAFVSFNDLGYVKDMDKFLKQASGALKKGAKFCFYIKSGVVSIAPNTIELDNKEEMLKRFAKANLTATYKKTKRLFKNEIFIYGKKK